MVANGINEVLRVLKNVVVDVISWWSNTYTRQSGYGKIRFGCGTLVVIFLCFAVANNVLFPKTQDKSTQDVAAIYTSVAQTMIAQMPTRPPTNTPGPVATSTVEAGTTRDSPIPAGSTVDIGGGMILAVVKTVRPADEIVMGGNQFNTKPETGEEYVEVDLQVGCRKSTSDKCYFFGSSVQAVGLDGKVRNPEYFVSGVEGLMDSSTEFFGGSSIQGKLFYVVPKGDTSVVLFYQALFGSPIYFRF